MANFSISFDGSRRDPTYVLNVRVEETSSTCTLLVDQTEIKNYTIPYPNGFDSEETLHEIEMRIHAILEDALKTAQIERLIPPNIPWSSGEKCWIRLLFTKVLRGSSLPLSWREPYSVSLQDA